MCMFYLFSLLSLSTQLYLDAGVELLLSLLLVISFSLLPFSRLPKCVFSTYASSVLN